MYNLQCIVQHKGTAAYSGHYVADIIDKVILFFDMPSSKTNFIGLSVIFIYSLCSEFH